MSLFTRPHLPSTIVGLALLTSTFFIYNAQAQAQEAADIFWLKVKAKDKFERTHLENLGFSIEMVRDDYAITYGNAEDVKNLENQNLLLSHFKLMDLTDFPVDDSDYHNYQEVTEALQSLAQANTDIIKMDSIGKSIEGRDIWHLTISTNLDQSHQKAGVVYMGGHHAREHLSIDTPLRLTKKLIEAYRAGDPRVTQLVESREIHMIPMVNPDGAEFDIQNGSYKMWRKNRRRNSDGSFGVDLNRNYGYQWGTGGSSKNPRSDTFMGPNPFSEPESQSIKNFMETHENISILLSFHTYSELILYPWGHSYNPVSDSRDLSVFKTMAQKMSQWNQYVPQQASELYQASGDTTDWAYGQLKVFAFTFELDPKFSGGGWGFYPGSEVISTVVDKNWEPFLYLMEYADNPYRSLDSSL